MGGPPPQGWDPQGWDPPSAVSGTGPSHPMGAGTPHLGMGPSCSGMAWDTPAPPSPGRVTPGHGTPLAAGTGPAGIWDPAPGTENPVTRGMETPVAGPPLPTPDTGHPRPSPGRSRWRYRSPLAPLPPAGRAAPLRAARPAPRYIGEAAGPT